MVLNNYRETGDILLLPIARKMKNVSPDTLSWVAFASAVSAGVLFFFSDRPSIVLMAVLMIFMNALFDALDGKVAKLTGKDSLRGDFLDHSLDRYADIFIIGGIALGPLSRLSIGFLAILGILMTSYMGTQAQAVGVERDYGGMAGRADRLVLLIIIPLLHAIAMWVNKSEFIIFGLNLNIMEVLMIWFAIAGHMTALHRGMMTWKKLS